jgi:hypothetical protein
MGRNEIGWADCELLRDAAAEIERLCDAKRRALALADEHAKEVNRLRSSLLRETLEFLNSIEGHGYGGMASFEIARMNIKDALVGRVRPLMERKMTKMHFTNERMRELIELGDDSDCTTGPPDRPHRLKMMEDALQAIATMDVFTREGEKPAHEVMRDLAKTALIGIPPGSPDDMEF